MRRFFLRAAVLCSLLLLSFPAVFSLDPAVTLGAFSLLGVSLLLGIVLAIHMLHKKHKQSTNADELLPPPPPFPPIDESGFSKKGDAPKAPEKSITKIRIRHSSQHVCGEGCGHAHAHSLAHSFLHSAKMATIPSQSPSEIPLKQQDMPILASPLPTHHSAASSADMAEIEDAISNISKGIEPKKPFWQRLFLRPKKEEPTFEMQKDNRTPLEKVRTMLHEADALLMELRLEETKALYTDIMKEYRQMTDSEQKQVYEDVRELYEQRKAAEAIHGR